MWATSSQFLENVVEVILFVTINETDVLHDIKVT